MDLLTDQAATECETSLEGNRQSDGVGWAGGHAGGQGSQRDPRRASQPGCAGAGAAAGTRVQDTHSRPEEAVGPTAAFTPGGVTP